MQLESCAQLTNRPEELLNALLHAVGAILAIIGTWFLLQKASSSTTLVPIIAALAYGGSTIFTLAISALYHASKRGLRRQKMRILDHAAIYVMIAGGYSPIFLIPLKNYNGILICSAIWILALLGILWKLTPFKKSELLSVTSYLCLGWSGIFFIEPIIQTIDQDALLLLLAGGVAYSLGTVFYLNDHRKYFHTVWHVLVLIGASIHYMVVLNYIV